MKYPRSARPTARRSNVQPLTTLPYDQSTLNQRTDVDIAMPATLITTPPLGHPDIQAFSAPGTLLDNDSNLALSAEAAKTPDHDLVTVSTMNTVIHIGQSVQSLPYDTAPTVAATQSPSSSTSIPHQDMEAGTGTGAEESPRRSQSAASHRSAGAQSITSAYDICRICHCEGSNEQPLISPCCCSGSLKYVHQKCLQQWIKSSQTRACEVCRFTFIMETKVKPFRKWEKLDISSVERRKILCSVTFHIVAITCVVWSLYVLIDRTAEEIRSNQLDWPFWTKLVVVAIGFTGGLVFMYVQCKMYVQLFRRWQSYNKVIYVQNGPAGGINNTGNHGKYASENHANGHVNGSALNK